MSIFIPLRRMSDNEFGGRAWAVGFSLSLGSRVEVFWETQARRLDGRDIKSFPVSFIGLQIRLNPREWMLCQEHTWYDGEICAYHLGPFVWLNFHRWACKRCQGES